MTGKITAVIMDTSSIQRYVFRSNKLKENIGASLIVESFFKDVLKGLECKVDLDWWKSEAGMNSTEMLQPPDEEVGIGYIGGGNALLFFKNEELAKDFAKSFSKYALINTPGMKIDIALQEVEAEEVLTNFSTFMKLMFNELNENKNKFHPIVSLPKFSVTKDCKLSGEVADTEMKLKNETVFLSSTSKAKMEKANQEEKNLKNESKFDFKQTNEIEKLGQKEGENWIAVVHIDGNDMGKRFQSLKSLREIRTLSSKTKEITQQAYDALLQDLNDLLNENKEDVDKEFHLFDEKTKQNLFPIRKILIGGDDVTFVCNAKLSFYLTEKFIEIWTERMNQNLPSFSAGNPFSATGGISIVKTKYPFYQAYTLAEEICSKAKKEVKEKYTDPVSSLDYYIHQGNTTAKIDILFQEKYLSQDGEIDNHVGPFIVNGPFSMKDLLEGMAIFDSWPRSKTKDLREKLCSSEISFDLFVKEMNARGLKLPGCKIAKDGNPKKLPYFSMLEVLEFHPTFVEKWRNK